MKRRASPLVLAALVASLATGAFVSSASAAVWPTEVDQLAQRLESADAGERRSATGELTSLPRALGAPLVRKMLGDADADVRIAASTGVLALRLDDVGDRVLPWLNEPDARIRAAACAVLRLARTKASVAPLGRVLSDADGTVRAAAASALGHQGASEAVVPLLGHLDDPSNDVRLAVIEALHRLGDPRAVVPLAGKVSDGAPEVRRAVVRALGSFADPRGTSALLVALRDANQEVRIEALSALALVGDPSVVLAILPLSERTAPAAVRRAALGALGSIGDEKALATLVTALDFDEPALAPARDALVQAGKKAIPALLRAVNNPPTPRTAAFAAEALGYLHAKEAAPDLLSALRSGVLPAPLALRTFALIGDPSLLPPVLERLGDASPATRLEARRAAETLLDPTKPDGRAVDPLAQALLDGKTSGEDRAALARLLGRTGSPRAVPFLTPLVRAKERPLRLAAVTALGQAGVSGQDAILLEAFADADAVVRARAGTALGSACNEATTRRLLDLAVSAEEQDRGALAAALAGAVGRATDAATFRAAKAALLGAEAPLRDALLEGLGKSPTEAARALVEAASKSRELGERRKAAEALGGTPAGKPALRALLGDFDAGVRANAAWSLGEHGDDGDANALVPLIEDASTAVAANAATGVGRIGARTKNAEIARKSLCPALADPRAYVRAAALSGLSLAGARCGEDGAPERAILAQDPSPVARAAAADTLAHAASAAPDKDRRARQQCHLEDPFGVVAVRCGAPRRIATTRDAVTVLVVPAGRTQAEPGAPFALEIPDGTIRHGIADSRGAVFVRDLPRGVVTLAVPAPFVR